MPRNNKQCRLKFSGSWSEPNPAAYGCSFLKSDLCEPRRGLQEALACLFGPIGLAVAGKSANEVEVAISKSRVIFESYMNSARIHVDAQAGSEKPPDFNGRPTVLPPVPSVVLNGAPADDDMDLIDLDED